MKKKSPRMVLVAVDGAEERCICCDKKLSPGERHFRFCWPGQFSVSRPVVCPDCAGKKPAEVSKCLELKAGRLHEEARRLGELAEEVAAESWDAENWAS
jgi:hypothetical protein